MPITKPIIAILVNDQATSHLLIKELQATFSLLHIANLKELDVISSHRNLFGIIIEANSESISFIKLKRQLFDTKRIKLIGLAQSSHELPQDLYVLSLVISVANINQQTIDDIRNHLLSGN